MDAGVEQPRRTRPVELEPRLVVGYPCAREVNVLQEHHARQTPRGVLAGWVTYVVFVALASVVYGPHLFGVVTDPSWLVGVFILGPVVGLSSVVAGVVVSARVNDPRVAQQVGGIIIVPIIAVTLLQATGTLLVGAAGVGRAAAAGNGFAPGRVLVGMRPAS